MQQDYLGFYAALELNPQASAEDIKRAYRRLAKELHPDRNPSPQAASQFQRLSSAYQVLSYASRRAEYDQANFSQPAPTKVQRFEAAKCCRCKKVTAQPRYLVFWTTISLLVGSWKTPTQGVFCAACARLTAVRCSAVSALFGWWGVWGLLWTPQSILSNAKGGERPPGSEARVLWFNALAFLSQGNLPLAFSLARQVSALNVDQSIDAAELITELRRRGVSDALKLKNPWSFRPAWGLAHVGLAVMLPGLFAGALLSGSPTTAVGGKAQLGNTSPFAAAPYAAAPKVDAPPTPTPAVEACGHQVENGEVLTRNAAAPEYGHKLEIRNGSGGPVIVKVRAAGTGKSVVQFYVAENATAVVGDLPDGDYRIQYGFGDYLGTDCRTFASLASAGQFPDTEHFAVERRGDQIVTQSLSYTLYRVPGGNVSPEAIDPSAFQADG